MKYTLKHPITFGETIVAEFNVRERIVAGDMRGIPMRDPMLFDDMLKLIGRLTAQPDPVINAMHLEDLEGVSEILAPFIKPGRRTGTGPSRQ